tara:strand:- start:1154 stop:1537 length:384 start_codon:yes stop_codon:yes gene_type:complete
MMSSFKGLDLFGSGVHRFVNQRLGRRVVSYSSLLGDPAAPGTFDSGNWEVWVEVHGRLVASSDAALWDLRDDILAQAASGMTHGVLVDEHGHSWTGMSLLTYEEFGQVRRGREVSVGYTVVFGRLTN